MDVSHKMKKAWQKTKESFGTVRKMSSTIGSSGSTSMDRDTMYSNQSNQSSERSGSAYTSFRHMYKHASKFEVDAYFLEELRSNEYRFPRDPSVRFSTANLSTDPWFDDDESEHGSRERGKSWTSEPWDEGSSAFNLEEESDEEKSNPVLANVKAAESRPRSFLMSSFRPLFGRKKERPQAPPRRPTDTTGSTMSSKSKRPNPVPPPKPRISLINQAKMAFGKGNRQESMNFAEQVPVLAPHDSIEIVESDLDVLKSPPLPLRSRPSRGGNKISKRLSLRRRSESSQPLHKELAHLIKMEDLKSGSDRLLSRQWSFGEAKEPESDDDDDTTVIVPAATGGMAALFAEIQARRAGINGTTSSKKSSGSRRSQSRQESSKRNNDLRSSVKLAESLISDHRRPSRARTNERSSASRSRMSQESRRRNEPHASPKPQMMSSNRPRNVQSKSYGDNKWRRRPHRADGQNDQHNLSRSGRQGPPSSRSRAPSSPSQRQGPTSSRSRPLGNPSSLRSTSPSSSIHQRSHTQPSTSSRHRGQSPSSSTSSRQRGQSPSSSTSSRHRGQSPNSSTSSRHRGQSPNSSTSSRHRGQSPSSSTSSRHRGPPPQPLSPSSRHMEQSSSSITEQSSRPTQTKARSPDTSLSRTRAPLYPTDDRKDSLRSRTQLGHNKGAVSAGLSDDSSVDLSKYKMMLKAKLPVGAVIQKMTLEGVDPSLLGLDDF